MSKSETIFRRSQRTSIITWLISIILSVISIKINHAIVWIPAYFYLVGFIAFVYSFSKYAVMRSEGIQIYMGSFLKKIELNIGWGSITSAGYIMAEKKWRTKTHGIDSVLNMPHQGNDEGVLINLKRNLENEEVILINQELGNKFKLPEEKRFIFLTYAPRGGFKKFLTTIQRYCGSVNINLDLLTDNKPFKYIGIDYFIGITATILLVWNIIKLH